MTATVVFQTGSADNALSVPNAALRVKPTDAMLAVVQNSATRRFGDSAVRRLGDSATRRASGSGARSDGGQQRGAGPGSTAFATLWTLGADGKTVKPIRVRTGLTDGQRTAITARDSTLTEGTQVIIGIGGDATAAAAPARTTQSANPFQPQRGPGGPRGF
jgi:HlyD family secretion protein